MTIRNMFCPFRSKIVRDRTAATVACCNWHMTCGQGFSVCVAAILFEDICESGIKTQRSESMRIFFCVALAMSCTEVSAQRLDLAACPCGPDWIAGADRDLIPQSWYGADFHSACRHHDACLDSGCANRHRCDRNFARELKSACKNSSRPG